jgi:hypothetical protein
MTTVLIVIAVVIVVAILVLVALTMQRRRHLKEQFGPEYDRLVDSEGGRRAAESELRERERRHHSLELRPLDPTTRDRYVAQWARVQELFVDDPRSAVSQAGQLLTAVMTDRGYPAEEDDEQRIADLSVEHSRTLDRYRSAHAVSVRADEDGASTEELRNAMVDYRALFQELLAVDKDLDTNERAGSEASARVDQTTEPAESEVSERDMQARDEEADRLAEERRPAMTGEPTEAPPESQRSRDAEHVETVTDDETRRV